MATPRAVVDWLNKTYPKPKVDPEWLDACYNWLISSDASLNPATDMDRIIRNVEVQLLGSNLSDSMIPGTGLPRNVAALNNTHLPFKQSPVLVEITAITEVGHSAFSLLNTRQTRIDREDLAGLGGDEAEQEEEGPIPRYPRSMLRLEISDGTTTMRAMEYRKLPELELGETPLGYKMLLKDVFIRGGIAFLEPNCVIMKKHQTEDREAVQDADFVRGLRLRLGHADEENENENENGPPPAPPPPPPQAAAAPQAAPARPVRPLPQSRLQPQARPRPPPPPPASVRSPFREISEPPSPAAGPSGISHEDDEEQPRRRRIPANSSMDPPALRQSQYFPAPSIPTSSAATLAAARTQLSPPRRAADVDMGNAPSSDYGDDIEFDPDMAAAMDEACMSQGAPPAASSASGSGSGTATTVSLPATSGSSAPASSGTRARNTRSASVAVPSTVDVITIDDEEEDDKENVPVPTRHIRRRTLPTRIPAIDGDVIDISD